MCFFSVKNLSIEWHIKKKIINDKPFAINENYRNRLLSYFDQHQSLSNFDKQKFEFFLESQTYWDYVFAKNIVLLRASDDFDRILLNFMIHA